MTARDFVGQALALNKEIRAKESQIQMLRDQATHVSAVMEGDKVQTSPKPDQMGDIVARIVDLVAEYGRDVDRLLALKMEIQQAINSVNRANYRAILTERYINFKRWEDIASDNNYSWRAVHKIHSRALEKIKECIEVHTIM